MNAHECGNHWEILSGFTVLQKKRVVDPPCADNNYILIL